MKVLNVLLEVTVYAAVIFAVIVLFKKLLKDRISSALQLAVWAMLIIRLLLPVTFDAAVHFITLPGEIIQIDSGDSNAMQSDAAEEFGALKADETGQSALPVAAAVTAQSREQGPVQTPAPSGEPDKTDWATVLIAVWAAGMAVFAGLALCGYMRLHRNVHRDLMPATEKLEALFDECRRELKINRRIKLCVQRCAQSPALLFPSTVLLPADVVEMNQQQVKLALMHELTHYRRKDHIVAMLLLVLRIVYWFNPVVHVAESMIREDIETACDHSVVKRLNPAEKGVYARSLISMYKNTPDTQMVLGMALGGTRKSAEKRIRGIYMKQKSQWRVKLTAALMAGVIAVCCFTTACQPTPDKPVIVNKNQSYDDIMSTDTGEAEENNEPYTVPEKLTENIEEGNLTIHADIPVELPQTTDFPVSIVKQRTFTQDEVDNIVDYFAQGRKMYKQKTFQTKDEIMDMITEARRGPLEGGVYDPAQVDENWIKELEQRYEKAPETFEKKYVDSMLDYCIDYDGTPLNSGEKAELNVNIENDKGIEETLHIMNANELYHSSEIFYRNGSGYYDETFYRNNLDAPDIDVNTDPNFKDWENQIKNTSMTEDEAIAQANAVLEAFHITGLGLVGIDRAAILDDNNNPFKGGYELTYMRSKGKLTGFHSDYWVMSQAPGEKMPEYAPPFEQERIEIMLNEDGIHVFSWVGIATEDETVKENAQLKPFEEIKQAAFNQMKYKYSFRANDEWHVRCELISAKLYLGYIGVKDDLNKALMVPMWVFVTQNYDRHESETSEHRSGYEAVAVNALDGSIVSTN